MTATGPCRLQGAGQDNNNHKGEGSLMALHIAATMATEARGESPRHVNLG